MKTIGSSIQRKIDDLSRQISQLEQEMEDGKNRERYLNNVIAEQNHIMNNASIEMAYHKKYLNG
jgi:peptidoglycan hydrolase CwlO-like protein